MGKNSYLCVHAYEAGKCPACFDEFGKTVLAADPEREGMPMSYGRYRELYRQGKKPHETMKALPDAG